MPLMNTFLPFASIEKYLMETVRFVQLPFASKLMYLYVSIRPSTLPLHSTDFSLPVGS